MSRIYLGTNPIIDTESVSNNLKINDVELFYQVEEPTVRKDGSPIRTGDRWYNPQEGIERVRIGSVWDTSVNLGYTASPTNGTVTNSIGEDSVIPLANNINAGLLSPAYQTLLTNITPFATNLLEDNSDTEARVTLGLGSAATKNTGTSIGNVVELTDVGGGTSGLPAVDGSLLLNVPGFADPLTTPGDLIIKDAENNTTRLPVGANNQVLKVINGIPAWAADLVGSGGGGGGLSPVPVTAADSPYTANPSELLQVDTSTGPITIYLPSSGLDSLVYVSDVSGNASTNAITVLRTGADTIIGDTAITITSDYAGALFTIDSSSTDWKISEFTLPKGGVETIPLASNTLDGLMSSVDYIKLDKINLVNSFNITGDNSLTFVTTGPTSLTLPTTGALASTVSPAFTGTPTVDGSAILSQADVGLGPSQVPANSNLGALAYQNEASTFVMTHAIQTVTLNGVPGNISQMDNGTHVIFQLTVNADTTIAHSNVPATERYGFELHLNWITGNITWPSEWVRGNNKPENPGSYIITGVTIDGGSTFTIAVI